MVEPWYGTAYSVEKINDSVIQVCCLMLPVISFNVLVTLNATVAISLGAKHQKRNDVEGEAAG